MSFDWSEYLNLAKKLIRAGSTLSANEACQRTAISRAYYAVYCQARNLARGRRWVTLTGTGAESSYRKKSLQKLSTKE